MCIRDRYKAVGELYGFPIKVVSERTLKEGLEFTDNRFVVEGNYKYTYNNGHQMCIRDRWRCSTRIFRAARILQGSRRHGRYTITFS